MEGNKGKFIGCIGGTVVITALISVLITWYVMKGGAGVAEKAGTADV